MADETTNWTFLNKPGAPNCWALVDGDAFISSSTETNQIGIRLAFLRYCPRNALQ